MGKNCQTTNGENDRDRKISVVSHDTILLGFKLESHHMKTHRNLATFVGDGMMIIFVVLSFAIISIFVGTPEKIINEE